VFVTGGLGYIGECPDQASVLVQAQPFDHSCSRPALLSRCLLGLNTTGGIIAWPLSCQYTQGGKQQHFFPCRDPNW
jgi:hypothetical protein